MRSLSPDRRALLLVALAGVSATVAATLGSRFLSKDGKPAQSTRPPPPEKPLSGYPMGRLAGHRIGDLYAHYIGYEGLIPARLIIDFPMRLDYMWITKIQASGRNRVVRETRAMLLSEFNAEEDPGLMSLVDYQRIAHTIAADLHRDIDWATVRDQYFKTGTAADKRRRMRLLANVASLIDGRELIAYALTELMPGRTNGAFNRDFLDFLLTYGGREFVERIPALYDDWTSFGTYQFTSFAVYDTPRERRGASVINLALPRERRIPGSVQRLRKDDHFKAAYLFGVHNLAMLIRRLDARQLGILERNWRTSRASIAQFVAVAHHGPAHAFGAGERWIDNRCRKPFMVSCAGRYLTYAQKTDNNYRALT